MFRLKSRLFPIIFIDNICLGLYEKLHIRWADLQPQKLEETAANRTTWHALTKKATATFEADRNQRLAAAQAHRTEYLSQQPPSHVQHVSTSLLRRHVQNCSNMIKVLFNIVKSLFSLVFSIFRPVRRLWCRRLKSSEIDPGIPTIVSTQSTAIDIPQSFEGAGEADIEMESWDAWDNSQSQHTQSDLAYCQNADGNGMVSQSTSHHSLRGRKPELEADPEQEPDYFQDMVPEVKRPAKILVKKKDNGSVNISAISNRLSMMGIVPTVGSELQSWEESENSWPEEVTEDLSWEAEAAIKEKRRAEREHRTMEQQKKKQQRDAMRGLKKDAHLAVKIS